jgi:hypothetical protein
MTITRANYRPWLAVVAFGTLVSCAPEAPDSTFIDGVTSDGVTSDGEIGDGTFALSGDEELIASYRFEAGALLTDSSGNGNGCGSFGAVTDLPRSSRGQRSPLASRPSLPVQGAAVWRAFRGQIACALATPSTCRRTADPCQRLDSSSSVAWELGNTFLKSAGSVTLTFNDDVAGFGLAGFCLVPRFRSPAERSSAPRNESPSSSTPSVRPICVATWIGTRKARRRSLMVSQQYPCCPSCSSCRWRSRSDNVGPRFPASGHNHYQHELDVA